MQLRDTRGATQTTRDRRVTSLSVSRVRDSTQVKDYDGGGQETCRARLQMISHMSRSVPWLPLKKPREVTAVQVAPVRHPEAAFLPKWRRPRGGDAWRSVTAWERRSPLTLADTLPPGGAASPYY